MGAYFRGGAYQAPPSLGNTTNPNEIALASLGGALPGMGGGAPSAEIIDAHLAVQGTIRSYQVRGHLAAQIDPLGLNNMEREKAKKMIIRSVTVDQKDMETVFQLPKTTFMVGRRLLCLSRRSLQGWRMCTVAALVRSTCTSTTSTRSTGSDRGLSLLVPWSSITLRRDFCLPGSVEVLALKGSLPRSGRVRRDLALKEL